MARLRDDYQAFKDRGVEILAIGPDGVEAFSEFWRTNRMPFIGLPDPDHRVASLYKQQVNIFKLGRMPLVSVIDRRGLIRFAHYGASMSDIPTNATLLSVIDQLAEASG